MLPVSSSLSFPIMETLGILAFALSGVSVAKAAQLDIVGTYFCALATALGGGTMRDVLINHRPFYWVKHEWLLLLILAFVALSYIPRLQHYYGSRSVLTCVGDAIGTGIFALSGLVLAMEQGFGLVSSVLMALITAILGGVLRDVVCGQVPYVFQRTELCATCVLLGCLLYFALLLFQVPVLMAFILGSAITSICRYFALIRGWKLPV